MCQLLFEILKHFPSEQDESSLFANNGRSFINLYVKMWHFTTTTSAQSKSSRARKFAETEEYQNLKKLIHLSSLNTINEIASSMQSVIKVRALEHEAHYESEFLNDIYDFYEILDKMKLNFISKNGDTSFAEEEQLPELVDETEPVAAAAAVKSLKKTASVCRKSSVRTLKVISENSPPKKSTLSARDEKGQKAKLMTSLKASMLDWLNGKFALYFDYDHYSQQAFMTHFCYSNMDKVKKALFDMQRLNMHECLLNSLAYLKINNAASASMLESPRKRSRNSEANEASVDKANSLLPLNVVYKLYLECGHMINLHDWLQVFILNHTKFFIPYNRDLIL
jgi:hypothetical protein